MNDKSTGCNHTYIKFGEAVCGAWRGYAKNFLCTKCHHQYYDNGGWISDTERYPEYVIENPELLTIKN